MADLKPLPKEITDEIRDILEGCRDGRLEHNQRLITCGTAHCIAGWKIVRDMGVPNATRCEIKGFAKNAVPRSTFSEWDYAMRAWGLTDAEAGELFDSDAKFPEQFALLEKLEKGERVQ